MGRMPWDADADEADAVVRAGNKAAAGKIGMADEKEIFFRSRLRKGKRQQAAAVQGFLSGALQGA